MPLLVHPDMRATCLARSVPSLPPKVPQISSLARPVASERFRNGDALVKGDVTSIGSSVRVVPYPMLKRVGHVGIDTWRGTSERRCAVSHDTSGCGIAVRTVFQNLKVQSWNRTEQQNTQQRLRCCCNSSTSSESPLTSCTRRNSVGSRMPGYFTQSA